jgi:cytochrome c oxidase cbb3-type subunit 2
MDNEVKLVSGAMVALAVATAALVVMPYMEVRDIQPPPGLKPYTSAELRGRGVYIANGCVYCHSQQPRDRNFGPDFERGWGRASVPGDYIYDKPHLLGSMRTGPDLFNIASRQPLPAARLCTGLDHAVLPFPVYRQGREGGRERR